MNLLFHFGKFLLLNLHLHYHINGVRPRHHFLGNAAPRVWLICLATWGQQRVVKFAFLHLVVDLDEQGDKLGKLPSVDAVTVVGVDAVEQQPLLLSLKLKVGLIVEVVIYFLERE